MELEYFWDGSLTGCFGKAEIKMDKIEQQRQKVNEEFNKLKQMEREKEEYEEFLRFKQQKVESSLQPQIPQQIRKDIQYQNPNSLPNIASILEGGMKDVGSGIQNIPHIIIGKKETPQPQQLINYPIIPQPISPMQNKLNKFKTYGLWIAVSLVVGFATYKIILAIIH